MFNFYVVLPGCDTAGLPHAGANSKPHRYKQSTKNEGPFENMSFSKNPFEDFNEKNNIKI